jgi:mycofactocin precursor
MPAEQPRSRDALVPEKSEPQHTDESNKELQEVLVETELLVEDVSIDGMCGVY